MYVTFEMTPADTRTMLLLIATMLLIHRSITSQYNGYIDSPVSDQDVNKTSLTIMGLFPMFGTNWPAGYIHTYTYVYIYVYVYIYIYYLNNMISNKT